jgi:5'-nucleotidase
VHPERPKGSRVDGLALRGTDGTAAPLDMAATYRLVTNSFLAGGGDGMSTLKHFTGAREDTGVLEHEALAAHLARLGVIRPPAQDRVRLGQGPLSLLFLHKQPRTLTIQAGCHLMYQAA